MPRQFHDPESLFEPAPLLRRLLAMLYDGLICIAVLILATWGYTMFVAWIIGFDKYLEMAEAGAFNRDPMLTSVLFVILYLFFAYFWTRTGQTLGMQVWRIRIENYDGSSISWTQALKRYMAAYVSWIPAGLGYLWLLWDPRRETWPDKFSGTQVVDVPPPPKPAKKGKSPK